MKTPISEIELASPRAKPKRFEFIRGPYINCTKNPNARPDALHTLEPVLLIRVGNDSAQRQSTEREEAD